MHLIQYVTAYTAAKSLAQKECSYKMAYAIMQLQRGIQPQCDFYAREEAKLIEEYSLKNELGETIINEEGRFTFADPSKAKEYAERCKDLGMLEVEDFVPLRAPEPETIKPAQLEALEGFIIFEGDNHE